MSAGAIAQQFWHEFNFNTWIGFDGFRKRVELCLGAIGKQVGVIVGARVEYGHDSATTNSRVCTESRFGIGV